MFILFINWGLNVENVERKTSLLNIKNKFSEHKI